MLRGPGEPRNPPQDEWELRGLIGEENVMVLRSRAVVTVLAVLCQLSTGILLAQSFQGEGPGGSLDDLLSTRVSTASLYSQLAREAPASVSIMSAEDINRFEIRTIAELVSHVRSFYLSNDRNYEYVGVRGFGRPTDYNNRILLLWNGHAMNDNVYSSAAISYDFAPDLNGVERVEIVRGPGSPLYGANAMLAVINIIGKTGAEINGVEAAAEYGSGAFARGSVLYGTQTAGGFDAVISGSWMDRRGFDLYYPEFDAPEMDNGIVRNAEREQAVGASGRIRAGNLTIMGIYSHRTKHIPTASYETDFADSRAMTEDARWGLEAGYAGELSPSLRITGRVAFDGYDYSGVYPYGYLQFDGSRGRWWTGQVHVQWDAHESNRLDVGGEIRMNPRADYRVWTEETYDFSKNGPYDIASAFIQDTWQVWPEVSISLAMRADHHSMSGWLVSPRAALVATPTSSSTVKALYGEAFRAPSVYELYYEDSEGIVSNLSLRDERVRTLEVSAEQRLSSMTYATVSLYQFSMWDLIEQTTVLGEAIGQHQNVGEAHARGIEGELIARSPAGHTASLSIGTQYGDGLGGEQELSNSPRTIIGASASVKFLERCEASVRGRYESSRITTTGTRTDPFFLVHAYLHVNRIAGLADLGLAVRNLFDVRYAYPGGFEHRQPAIAQDGRTITLRLVVRW
jgi:outer membrane receptor for ferrienterochelin and colicin